MKTKVSLLLALTLSIVMVFGSAAVSKTTFVTIGTGGVTGVYYPAGGSIARLVNKGKKEHGVRVSVESTDGGVYNINAIASGDLDMGITQSEWQFHAYNGTSKFMDKGPNKELRAIFSIYPEPFTVVARADAGINNFTDLRGKRVNVGNPGSGQRATMEVLMDAFGWDMSVYKFVSELRPAEQSKALCDNEIDAFVYTVGHPNGSIKEATISCESALIDVTGDVVDKLVADNPYYRYMTIPGGMYRGNDRDIKTFGVDATFITSSKAPENVIYAVVKSVFEDLESFKELHPAFSDVKKDDMIQNGLSAPFHDGAAKYYKEVGLLK